MEDSIYSSNFTVYLHEKFITICARSWRGGSYAKKHIQIHQINN